MFVTADDFNDLPYSLPQLGEVDNTFPLFVQTYEDVHLSELLGWDFYNALKAGVAALPVEWDGGTSYAVGVTVVYGSNIYTSLVAPNENFLPDISPAEWMVQPVNRWLQLLKGIQFLDQYGETANWVGIKQLCIPMIYSEWLKEATNDTVTSAGTVSNDAENGSVISAAIRISKSWNAYRNIAVGVYNSNDCLWNYLYANATQFNDIPVNSSRYKGDFLRYLQGTFCDPGKQSEFDF